MQLNHFKTPEAALGFITDTVLWDMREDLSRMTGSEAASYSDEECATLEDKIADIEALSRN